jgi:hypothetical protein
MARSRDKKRGKKKGDGLAKRRKQARFVIPTKAGIEYFQHDTRFWIPAFAGMTTIFVVIIVYEP